MKVRIQLEAAEAASAAQAFVEQCASLRSFGAAVRTVEQRLALEDARTDRVFALFDRFSQSDAIDFDLEVGASVEGDELPFTIEGEVELVLESLLASRRDAKVYGNLLLDLVALLEGLELTEVRVKLGQRRASLEALSDAIVRRAGELSEILTPARERHVDAEGEELDPDDEDEDGWYDEDDDADDDDAFDDDDDAFDDDDDPERHGIPRDGWGSRPSASRPPDFTSEELFYLEVARLTWPCGPEAVRAGVRFVARYHPDRAVNPTEREERHEQFIRLMQGQKALLARLGAEVRR